MDPPNIFRLRVEGGRSAAVVLELHEVSGWSVLFIKGVLGRAVLTNKKQHRSRMFSGKWRTFR
ncbi:MAG: hypothetical protein JWQ01_1133 [Massilia sp.]|nr:hypothetical protein [Massilia sp.]